MRYSITFIKQNKLKRSMVISNILAVINTILLSFLLAELILTIVFDKHWKFRFKRIKNHPNLRPYSKRYKVVSIVLLMLIIIIPILDYFLWPHLTSIIKKLGHYQWSLLFISLPIAYLWTEKIIIGEKQKKKWKIQDAIPISVMILSSLISSFAYYFAHKSI